MKNLRKTLMRKSKVYKSESRKPLLGNNNENMKDAYNQDVIGCKESLAQNTFNIQEEQHLQRKEEITHQQLTKLLEVEPGDVSSTSGQNIRCLIQRSVCQHFPKPPKNLDQNLPQHLLDVQNTVLSELMRLGPKLEPVGLMGSLIECYHHHTCEHLRSLLQNVSSTRSYFVLLDWGLKTYLSREMLGNPAIQKLDPIKKVDLLLFTEWKTKAKEKLLENVQKAVRESLEEILQTEREKKDDDSDEDYVRLYVDTILCINAIHTIAQQISSKLSAEVQEVCFQELLTFVRRYTTEHTELLRKVAKLDEPETIHFFKALKMCIELRKYVEDNGSGNSLCGEIGKMLQNLEAFTLKLLMDVVTDVTKRHLKTYFTAENKYFPLLDAVKKHFPNLPDRQDVQKTVMDEAYKVIVGVYVEQLINTSQSKLKKCWSPEVGPKVAQDAALLHCTICDLAPGVQPWNLRLQKVAEVLECSCNDGLKITVAGMQRDNLTKSEDPELLCKLLQWKGLSKWEVREVLDAVPPDYQPRARSGSWYSCLACW